MSASVTNNSWQKYRPCMKRLMLAIGKRMSDNPERWITRTWITPDSTLWDFGLEMSEMREICAEIEVPWDEKCNLGDIADQMVARGDFNG